LESLQRLRDKQDRVNEKKQRTTRRAILAK